MSLGGGSRAQSTSDQRLNAIPVSSSSYGNAIPLLYGQNRINLLLLWYNNFIATAHTTSQGGGKGGGGGATNTTYTYTASCIMALAEGPITSVGQVWNDQDLTTYSALGLTLFTGAGGQATWSYLTSNYPAQAVPYDHTAYFAQANMNLGDSAALPNYNFEVTGFVPYNAGTINDAEPSAILHDYCTDPNHGCQFPYLASAIFGSGTTSYQSYCIAMGFFVSPYENSQRSAVDFIKEILQITNSNAFLSAGALNIVPYCDVSVTGNSRTYTPNLTPLYAFTDDDFLPSMNSESGASDPVIVDRTPLSQTYNTCYVEYLDRSNSYAPAIATATDANDIALNGVRVMSTLTFHEITTLATAQMVAQLILQRQLYIRNTYTFTVRADYSLLEPMDLVAITDTNLGISDVLVRITQVDDDENDNFTITAEDMLVGPASAPLYSNQAVAGYNANWNVAPPSVATPLIFTLPPLLVDPNGGFELGLCIDQGAAGSWSGADVYMSLDNASYIYVGTINGAARYGTLTANLAMNPDPDTTDTLAVALTNAATTTRQLVSGSAADYNNLRTLLYVDGEIMAYETATLTSPGNYNLTMLRRGQYGSAPAAHSSGASWARIDAGVFRVPFDPGMMGQTVYFKFCSFNVYQRATQALSAASAYSHVLSSTNAGQLQPGPLTLVGSGVTVSGNQVFKSASTSAFDSNVYSLQGYTNGAFATFQPANYLSFVMGLSTNPTASTGYSNINYGFFFNGGTLDIYESGTNIGTFGTANVGDILSVTYDGAFVRYLQNGNLLRQTPAAPGLTFYLDGSFYNAAVVTNLQFGPYGTATPVMFIARGQCVVSDESVQKLASGTSSWTSGDAYSINGYTTCNLVFKCNSTAGIVMAGLAAAIPASPNYTGINYAFECDSSGALRIYESGTLVTTLGTYAATDYLAITYDGSTVTYWWNGVSQRTVSVSNLTLFAYIDVYNTGGGLNSINFGPGSTIPLVDTGQVNLNAVSQIASNFSASAVSCTAAPTHTTDTDIISVTVTTTGDPIAVDLSCNYSVGWGNTAPNTAAKLYFYMDGSLVSGVPYFDAYAASFSTAYNNGYGGLATLSCTFTPAAGSHTFTLHAEVSTGGTSGSSGMTCTQNAIKVREIKR